MNDISIPSIKATLQSNHTLTSFKVRVEEDEIERQIAIATKINRMEHNLEGAGIEKEVIRTQLRSAPREKMTDLQGIDTLLLPEVLSFIDRNLEQENIFVALKSSIMALFSTANAKKCIQQERKKYAA